MFAPSNAAFDELSDVTIQYLQSEEGQPTTRAIISYHMASGVYPSMDLLSIGNGTTIISLYRDDPALIQVWQDANRETVWLSNVGDDDKLSIRVVQPDVLANNGIFHVISSVMTLPPPAATTPVPTEDTVPGTTPPVPTPPPQPSGGIRLVVATGGAAEIITWLLTAVTLAMPIW